MGKWLLAALFFMMIIHGSADARSRRAARSSEPDENGIAATAPAPSPAVTAPAQPPQQQSAPAGAPSTPSTPGASQIFVWKEGNTLHAVNNLSDVPPRYSKQVESADKNPLMIRMVAEGVRPAAAKLAKKPGKGKSKRQTRSTTQPAASPRSKNPAAAKGAPRDK
jgi:hypothetical protein